jgi:hypothetical protein
VEKWERQPILPEILKAVWERATPRCHNALAWTLMHLSPLD